MSEEKKKYTAIEVAVAILDRAKELTQEVLEKIEGSKSKHDRCVEHVEESNPNIRNPHAVCVAAGVKPSEWNKAESSVREAVKDIKGPAKINEILPQVAQDKRAEVLKELRSMKKAEKKLSKKALRLKKFIDRVSEKRSAKKESR